MKIRLIAQELVNRINMVSRVVPSTTTLPILTCIFIKAENGEVTFTGNNLELGTRTKVKAVIEKEGVVAVDVKLFSNMAKKLPDDEVTIETDSSNLVKIRCGKVKFDIPGMDGSQFPELPSIENGETVTLPQGALKDALKKTMFSISANENNKMMTGGNLKMKDGKLKVTTLDGHRVAIRVVNTNNLSAVGEITVPGKALNEVERLLKANDDFTVDISFAQNQVLFGFEDTVVVTRLIEGDYYNTDQIISAVDTSNRISVYKDAFFSAVDRSQLLIPAGNKKPVVLDIKDHVMGVSVMSQLGSLNESIDVDGDFEIKIGFNPMFLSDIMRAVEDETIDIYFMNPKAPAIIKNDDGSYLYVILPVNFH